MRRFEIQIKLINAHTEDSNSSASMSIALAFTLSSSLK